jgi:hypothetical protein
VASVRVEGFCFHVRSVGSIAKRGMMTTFFVGGVIREGSSEGVAGVEVSAARVLFRREESLGAPVSGDTLSQIARCCDEH